MTRRLAVTVVLAVLLAPAAVWAQAVEVPILVIESPETVEGESDAELDLANLVQTAAKGVTTVQEAPAIITIIPGDELRDRGIKNLDEALDLVPGWSRYGAEHSQFPFVNTRGTLQAMLFMHDGVSFFDPTFNVATVSRVVPIETVKRIEVVTGPGGVLWGANSYLGVVNLITKDAEDVNGVEAQVGYGDGPGDRQVLRGYAMYGNPGIFSDKIKLFHHMSFESWIGPRLAMPAHMFSTPLPQPNSPDIYGPITVGEPPRSFAFNFDGKLTLGPLNLYYSIPLVEKYHPLGFPGTVVRKDHLEDTVCVDDMGDVVPCDAPGAIRLCTPLDPNVDVDGNGLPDAGETANDSCIDRGQVARKNGIQFYDRYGIAEYKARFGSKAGLTVKGYFIQFVRAFLPLQVLQPVPGLIEGGLSFRVNATTYRAGGAFDGDMELPGNVRLLYGAEVFRDWLPDNTRLSRQGAGAEMTFDAPYDLTKLPLPCPRTAEWDGMGPANARFVEDCPLTFIFETDRTVIGAFAAGQWRGVDNKLILDAGVRVQAAPSAFSSRPYDPQIIGAGAIVYEFIPDWHLKLNYAQGFRPPVFNNTDSNGEAVEFDGERDLKVEHSDAFQAEVNARLFKGRRRIRELDLRADYSYTRLSNFISVFSGRYANEGQRGLHSAELLTKLYLKGDHRIELAYTWLRVDSSDRGTFRALPEHWFNVGGVFNLIPGQLEAHGTLRIFGAFEDPNLRVEARDLHYDMYGQPGPEGQVVVNPFEQVLDRIPPSGELQIGVRYFLPRLHTTIQATAYNTLNARRFQPDGFFDYEPRLEFLPNPYEDFRFFASATVNY
jgi:outer membrane receptor protein involved in Fe transport